MPLISPTEKMAMERGKEIGKELGKEIGREIGRELGILENARHNVKTILQTRFGEVSSDMEKSLLEILDISILEQLLKMAVTVNSLEDFQEFLQSQKSS